MSQLLISTCLPKKIEVSHHPVRYSAKLIIILKHKELHEKKSFFYLSHPFTFQFLILASAVGNMSCIGGKKYALQNKTNANNEQKTNLKALFV